MKRIALFLFFIFSVITCLAQTQIDPTYQIQWNLLSGSGSPTITCTQNGNYTVYPYGAEWGQSYQDTTNNVEYKCTNSGWVKNLPTTGGTLTGALNGTSASFSGTVSATSAVLGPTTANAIQAVGQGTNSTIQAAITAAGTTGGVVIPANYAGTDTYTNPNGIQIIDHRQQTAEIARLNAFMTPFLIKLGASSGGNLTTLAKCIAAGGPCVISGVGNSILGGGGTAYQNGVWMQIVNALRAQYPTVIFTAKNYTLGGRLTSNAVPYSTSAYPQLPLCPTNTPACYSLSSGTPFNSISYSAAYGFANPLSGTTNASYGPPFMGADDFPWPTSPLPAFQGWVYTAVLDNPDALFLLFSMNDEGNTGYTFSGNMQAIIAPFLSLPKVPSIVLVAGPNGSISPSGQGYFSALKYSNLDEFAADLRGMAKQNSYGLVDAARIFSALRDGSDPESPIWEQDTAGFNNFGTNWAYVAGSGTITNGGYTLVTTGPNATQAIRKQFTRDSLVAGVWDTSNINTIAEIFWRAPSSSVLGYQALLFNNGSGNWGLIIYSPDGPGYGIASVTGAGLTSSTSFMVQATGNEYRVWVNGKLVLSPDTASCGVVPAGDKCGYDYDTIGYGYSGVGTTSVGTSYTSSITAVTLEYGSQQQSCASPLSNRQSTTPCAPAFVSDESLYGWATDYGSNLKSAGGNQINHPSIYGALATYGVAAVPFLDHLQSAVAVQASVAAAASNVALARVGVSNVWTAAQTLPTGSSAVTQTAGDGTTKIATDAYADASVRTFDVNGSTGALSSVVTTAVYQPFLNPRAATAENIVAVATSFTCTVNPVISFEICGTAPDNCPTPTVLGSVTLTSSGVMTAGTITSPTVQAGRYVAWKITAGTCTALNIQAAASLHN